MKPLQVTILAAIIILILGSSASAQISAGGTPVSFGKAIITEPPEMEMPAFDIQAMLAEDAEEAKLGIPFRFGKPFEVDFNLDNSGFWTELEDGSHIWRIQIVSPGAYSINLIYSRYRLPDGARLFVYNEDRTAVLGAFTSANNKDHGQFATSPTPGEACVVEYYEPVDVRGKGELTISSVIHGYRDVFGFGRTSADKGYGESGSCNNNINCPEGEPWQDEKRAVAMILTAGGSRICSGSLVNNIRQDETPYFLTANHCLGGETTWIFMFNYESPGCTNANGPTYMTVQGSTLRATYTTSDFALLELTEQPPEFYGVYFAGWSNIDVASTSSTGIHHPSGDIKKISFDYDPVTSANYLQTSGTTHWRIGNWEDGTTEGGSSGSPLFDQNHRVVGQLHGGYASCTSITPDWYGKFAMSWDGGGSSSNRLKDWLDPDNTGATTLDGFDPYASVTITHDPLSNTIDTLNDYGVICTIKSNADLVADSLLLFYEINSVWSTDLLESTGAGDEYHGFIPTQPQGTSIYYYIFAKDSEGRVDTTDIYSFMVEYIPAISVTPASFDITLELDQSTQDTLVITNSGLGILNYSIKTESTAKNSGLIARLESENGLAPARRDYSEEFYTYYEPKGDSPSLCGYVVDKDAGGPDEYGYYWIDSDEPEGPVFDWIDITGSGEDMADLLDDDSYAGPFDIGFAFNFYGNVYTQLYVGSNGIIGFDTTSMKLRQRTPLPTATTPNNIMAWLWDDLDPTDDANPGAQVLIHNDGSRCVIQFVDYPEYNAATGDVITAEVVLYNDGTIIYQYLSIASGFDVSSCAVGIESADGTDGLEVAYLSEYLHDSLTVKFFLPYQWLTMGKTAGVLEYNMADTIPCEFATAELDTGLYNLNIIISSNDPDQPDNPWNIPAQLHVTAEPTYVCGDASGNGLVNILDVTFLIKYLYQDGPAPDPIEAGDADGNGAINILDVTYLVHYLYLEGSEPVCP
nr:trypsin-like peptidase domain-containing protein [candidate division Zixibacteria bacterium]